MELTPPPPPALILSFLADGVEAPPALVEDVPGVPRNPEVNPEALPVLDPRGDLRYRIRFQIPSAPPIPALYDSPLIDDVTVFFTTGIEILSWQPVSWN